MVVSVRISWNFFANGSSMAPPDEKEATNALVRRCLDGDQQAWYELEQTYRGAVRRHVINILRKYNCASLLDDHLEGIINYIFEELFIYLSSYNFTNFEAWFARLRWSKTLDYLRSEIKYEKRTSPYDDRLGEPRKDRGDTAEGERAVLRRQVRSLVDTLPDNYALPLKFFFFEGLSYNEIAELLGVSSFVVGMRISRGKKMLRKILSEKEGAR